MRDGGDSGTYAAGSGEGVATAWTTTSASTVARSWVRRIVVRAEIVVVVVESWLGCSSY